MKRTPETTSLRITTSSLSNDVPAGRAFRADDADDNLCEAVCESMPELAGCHGATTQYTLDDTLEFLKGRGATLSQGRRIRLRHHRAAPAGGLSAPPGSTRSKRPSAAPTWATGCAPAPRAAAMPRSRRCWSPAGPSNRRASSGSKSWPPSATCAASAWPARRRHPRRHRPQTAARRQRAARRRRVFADQKRRAGPGRLAFSGTFPPDPAAISTLPMVCAADAGLFKSRHVRPATGAAVRFARPPRPAKSQRASTAPWRRQNQSRFESRG